MGNWWEEQPKPTGSLASLQPTTQPPSVPAFDSAANNPYATQLAKSLQAYRNRPSRFSTEPASLPTPAQPPEADKPAFDLGNSLSALYEGATEQFIPGVKSALAQAYTGLERPDRNPEWATRFMEEGRQAQQQADQRTAELQRQGQSDSTSEAIRSAIPSLGFSLGSMAAAIPAGLAGAAATQAAIPIPGSGLVGGALAAGAASGVAGYRMAGSQFLNDTFAQMEQESQKQRGRGLTEQEKATAYQELRPVAENTGLWEAGPEAIGNAALLGLGRVALGLMPKAAMQNLAASALGRAGVRTGAAAGALATEVGTEGVTQFAQGNDQQKGQAAVDALLSGKDMKTAMAAVDPQYQGFQGLVQSTKDVAPATIATVLLMGGLAKPGHMAYSALQDRAETNRRGEQTDEILANTQPFRAALDRADAADLSQVLSAFNQIREAGKIPKSAMERLDSAQSAVEAELTRKQAIESQVAADTGQQGAPVPSDFLGPVNTDPLADQIAAEDRRAQQSADFNANPRSIGSLLNDWNQRESMRAGAVQGGIAADRARLSEIAQQQVERQRQETLADRTQAIQQQEAERRARLNAEIATRGAPGELARLLGPETQAPTLRQEAPVPQSLSDLLNRPSQSSAVPTARAGERGSLSDLFPQQRSTNRNWWDTELSPSKVTTETPAPPKSGWARFGNETGTLNIPRAEMPQVKAEHRGALVNFLNARGVAHEADTEVDPATLKPTQAEFSPQKVRKAINYQGGDRSILVSSDGYVLDGHHQWLAALEQGKPIKAIRLDAPIANLLPLTREFPSSTVSKASNVRGGQTGREAPPTTAAPTQPETPSDETRKAEAAPLLSQEAEQKGNVQKPKAKGVAPTWNDANEIERAAMISRSSEKAGFPVSNAFSQRKAVEWKTWNDIPEGPAKKRLRGYMADIGKAETTPNRTESQGKEPDKKADINPSKKAVKTPSKQSPPSASKGAIRNRTINAAVDSSKDSLLTAIAKIGGLDRAESQRQGIDPAEFKRMPVFGKPTFRKSGGKSFDAMAESLSEFGYPVLDEKGQYSPNVLLDAISRELAGSPVYTTQGIESAARRDAAEQAKFEQDNWLLDAVDLENAGFDALNDQEQVTAQLQAEASRDLGEDAADTIFERISQQHEQATPEQFNEALRVAFDEARQRQSADSRKQAGEPGSIQASDAGRPILQDYSIEELRAEEERIAKTQAEQDAKDKAAQQKTAADLARSDFVLTGSNRPADVAMARGQTNLLGAMEGRPKTRFSRAALSPIAKEAISYFGTTKNLEEAGYVLPDGTLLDFSGRSEASKNDYRRDGNRWIWTGKGRDYLSNQRSIDHREVSKLPSINKSFTDAMLAFQRDAKALRIDMMSGRVSANFSDWSPAQMRAAMAIARNNDRSLTIDFDHPVTNRLIRSIDLDRASQAKINALLQEENNKDRRFSRNEVSPSLVHSITNARAQLVAALNDRSVAALERSGKLILHSTDPTRTGAAGYVDPQGAIHLIPSNMDQDALSVALHEAMHLARDDRFSEGNRAHIRLAHAALKITGLKNFIGNPGFSNLVQQLHRMAAEGDKTAIEALDKARREAPGNVEDEALAYLVQYADEKLPLVRRIIAAIRAALYRMGIKVKLMPADVRALALSALKARAKDATMGLTVRSQAVFSLPEFAPTEADKAEVERQIKAVKEVRDGQGHLLAPNGKPSNLNERQWKQVRTKFFKGWFGDWENDPQNSSKVVDDNGEPLVVYHGTKHDISIFDRSKLGKTTKAYSAKFGFFFSDNPRISSTYSYLDKRVYYREDLIKNIQDYNKQIYGKLRWGGRTISDEEKDKLRKTISDNSEEIKKLNKEISDIRNKDKIDFEKLRNTENGIEKYLSDRLDGDVLYSSFLSIKNPSSNDFHGMRASSGGFGLIFKKAIDEGNDGVIVYNVNDSATGANLISSTVYSARDPSSIKSAIGNAGTFSARSNRIDYSQPTTETDAAEQDRLWQEFQAVRAQFQAKQASQSAFDRWFGKGVEGINARNGKPLVLYHGTNNPEFNRWDESRSGQASQHPTAGLGFFMTADKRSAARYGSRLLELHAKIDNPYYMTDADLVSIESMQDAARFRRKLQAQGYDAAVISAPGGAPYVVVLRSNQVKLASNETPTESEDFRYSIKRIANRFRLTDNEVVDALNSPISQLTSRDELIRNNVTDAPAKFNKYKIGSAKVEEFGGDVKNRYINFLREFDPNDLVLSESEEGIKKHPTYQQYVKWANDGIDPPYIFVAQTESGKLQATNRRRTLAAREAGRKIQGWYGPFNQETGNPLKYGDILDAAGENRYSRPSGRQSSPSAEPLPAETMGQAALRAVQDRFIRFQVIQDWLKQHGVNLTPDADVYGAESLLPKVTAARTQDAREKTLKPLIESAAEKKWSIQGGDLLAAIEDQQPLPTKFKPSIPEFLHAQHAIERNAQIAKLKGAPKDGSGLSDAQAHEILTRYRVMPNFSEFLTMAEKFRAITDQTRRILRTSGIISADQDAAWTSAYKKYVPLKGGPDTASQQTGAGPGISVNPGMKRALGHRLRDENIIENIWRDHERAIYLSEKQKVTRALRNMLDQANNQNIGTVGQPEKKATLHQGYYHQVWIDGNPLGAYGSYNEAKAAISSDAQQSGRPLSKYAVVHKPADPAVVFMSRPMLADNEVALYENGQRIRLQLNDELLARAARNLGVDGASGLLKAAQSFNRWLSHAYTGYNPEFILANVARDMTTGMINLSGQYGGKFALKTLKGYGSAVRGLWKQIHGNADPWVDRYRAAGGSTGAAYLSDLERIGTDLKRIFQDYQGASETLRQGDRAEAARVAVSDKIRWLGGWIEKMNQVGENALRVATFRAMVEAGHSDAVAARAAGDVTVNFNRKGELTPTLGGLYLFFNPSIQGTKAMWDALAKGAHRGQAMALAGSLTLLALTLAELARGGDDADEEAWKRIPGYVKDRNLVIKMGDIQGTIPIPYGYGAFWSLGNILSDLSHGEDKTKAGIRFASSLFEQFSAIGNPFAGDEADIKNAVSLLPTALKPMMEIAMNRNSLGRPIMPEMSPWNTAQPDSARRWRSTTGSLYDGIASGLNRWTGGNAYQAGAIDISPETLSYLWRTFTGGAGKFAIDSMGLGTRIAQGVSPELREIPVFRKFVRAESIQDARTLFNEQSATVRLAVDAFNAAKRAKDLPAMRQMLDEQRQVLVLGKVLQTAQKMIRARRELEDRINQSDLSLEEKRAQLKAVENQESSILSRFTARFEKAKQESR